MPVADKCRTGGSAQIYNRGSLRQVLGSAGLAVCWEGHVSSTESDVSPAGPSISPACSHGPKPEDFGVSTSRFLQWLQRQRGHTAGCAKRKISAVCEREQAGTACKRNVHSISPPFFRTPAAGPKQPSTTAVVTVADASGKRKPSAVTARIFLVIVYSTRLDTILFR